MKKPKAKQCPCGQWFEGTGKLCRDCRKGSIRGLSSGPLYNTWSVSFNKKWPDFMDFFREVGNPPTPGHVLRPRIAGTAIAPGNVKWQLTDKLEDLNLHELTPVEDMLDPEMRRLAAQSYEENTESPISKISTIRSLEKEFLEKGIPDDLEKWQLQLERDSHDYSVQLKQHADSKQAEKGRGSQIRVGQSLRRKLLPGLAIRLQEMHQSALQQRAGRHHALVKPMIQKLDNDYELIAHITLSCVLDCVGRGSRMSTPMVQVLQMIGERLDHQAFLELVKQKEPQTWERIDRFVLSREEKGYKFKIKEAKYHFKGSYYFMSNDECVKVGEWCFNALQTITSWFDTIRWYIPGKRSRFQYYLGLSEAGLQQIDLIQTAVNEYAFEAWPMVAKPLRWTEEERGGYYKFHPGSVSQLIHRDKGTIPSKTAMDALHKAQEVPFKINRFIYETQLNLLAKSEEIGSFRTYEKDSWEDQNRPRINPNVWDNKYDENRNITKEYREAMDLLRMFYSEQSKSEKQYSKAPMRVLKVAARFLNVERFYIPCYFDTRLRLYYTVDTVTPNGSDYQKALLMSADGKEVTDENREAVERDLLITLANTWANKEDGIKTDKLSYEGRVAFARDFLRELEGVAKDPLTTSSRCLWTTASEPFQFLACVREYYEVCVWKSKTHTHLMNGRDATNSGMQLLGAISKDEKACYFTNVVPSETPQDLYGEVSREAQALLNSDVWVHNNIQKYIKQTKKKMAEREKKGQSFKPPDYTSFMLGMDAERVDRSILKKAVMCTSYGASWGSKNEYISEEIEEAFKQDPYNPSLTDKRLVTDAAIQGQSTAFPQCDILNDWFKHFGKACMAADQEYVQWLTPNGSMIRQEYREPTYKQVKTHAMGGASYYQVRKDDSEQGIVTYSVMTGYGAVKENKSSTALGANWTHSLDACLLQNTIASFDKPFYTVHDCFYGLAGDMDEFCAKARAEFKFVVESEPMHTLVKCNEADIDLPPMGDADISCCIDAPYMFC